MLLRTRSLQSAAWRIVRRMFKDTCDPFYSPSMILTLDYTFLREAPAGTAAMQQNICRVLGALDYNAHPHGLLQAIRFLVSCTSGEVSAQIFVGNGVN